MAKPPQKETNKKRKETNKIIQSWDGCYKLFMHCMTQHLLFKWYTNYSSLTMSDLFQSLAKENVFLCLNKTRFWNIWNYKLKV